MGRLKLLQMPCVIKWKYPCRGCPEIVSQEVIERRKQHKTIATAVGCSLELDVKTLILKRPNALVTEYRDITLTLGWKPPPCGLAFIVPEGTIHPAGGKLMSNSLILLWSLYATIWVWGNNGKSIIGINQPILGCFGFPLHKRKSTGTTTNLIKAYD